LVRLEMRQQGRNPNSIRRRRYCAPCGKEDRTKVKGGFTHAHIQTWGWMMRIEKTVTISRLRSKKYMKDTVPIWIRNKCNTFKTRIGNYKLSENPPDVAWNNGNEDFIDIRWHVGLCRRRTATQHNVNQFDTKHSRFSMRGGTVRRMVPIRRGGDEFIDNF